MEIDITEFVTGDAEPFEFSRSRAEAGQDAGPTSWRNALGEAAERPMLTTEEHLGAMRDWAKSSGGWDDEEIAAWSDNEINALFVQLVSGDMREAGMNECDMDEFDWEEYERRASEGQISGNIYRADVPGHESFGRLFYTLDS